MRIFKIRENSFLAKTSLTAIIVNYYYHHSEQLKIRLRNTLCSNANILTKSLHTELNVLLLNKVLLNKISSSFIEKTKG